MRILVPIKRVPDYGTKVKVNSGGNGFITDGIKWVVNPFDEIAIEEALRLKERALKGELPGINDIEIVVCSIGPEEVTTQLRHGMAMGADSGILVRYDNGIDSDLASRVLAAVYKRNSYNVIILGKQAIDSDRNQTAQLLASRLKLPQVCFASKVDLKSNEAHVTSEVDGGLVTYNVSLPAVISTDLRLNEPRYASLPGVMKAKKKPLEVLTLEELGVEPYVLEEIINLVPPPPRKGGKRVSDVSELLSLLRSEKQINL